MNHLDVQVGRIHRLNESRAQDLDKDGLTGWDETARENVQTEKKKGSKTNPGKY